MKYSQLYTLISMMFVATSFITESLEPIFLAVLWLVGSFYFGYLESKVYGSTTK